MATHNLIELDKKIRATITQINAEGLRLHGRRNELTETGLRAQWDRAVEHYRPQVEEVAAEVEEVAAALEKVEGFEREHLLRTIPAAGLTAAEELAVQRVLARPGSTELENLPGVIRPYLETPVATVLVEEVQARNESVTDEYVTTILSEESALYAESVTAVQHGKTILGVLRQGVEALHNALAPSNVNGHELDSHARPGSFIPSLQQMFGEDAKFTVGDNGNVHV